MKSRALQFVVFAAWALLLAACHKLQATTEVKPDGSGELRTGVGFSAEERQNLENQSGNEGSDNFCNSSGQTSPDVTVAEEQRGDETWCITTTKFDDLEELRRLYEEKKGIRINRLEVTDGKFYYDIDLDTSSETSDFSAFTAITWTVVLPGTPVYHNATLAEGNTLTWNPTPQSGTINLRAESPARGPKSLLPFLTFGLIFLCGCGVAVLGGVGGFFLLRRLRRPPR